MIEVEDKNSIDFETVPVDPFWNTSAQRELMVHRIHSYPAKFPAFITTKALEYCGENGVKVHRIGDIFCGCGTTVIEARRHGIRFWGCDINPVATLIATVKSKRLQESVLTRTMHQILKIFYGMNRMSQFELASDRLMYWHRPEEFNDLYYLKIAIDKATACDGRYRAFFYCAFSNILKTASRWRTKSIKPSLDRDKAQCDVIAVFVEQCEFMFKANREIDFDGRVDARIVTDNILSEENRPPKVDLIVTSPPYVTSYEYADLHQLSSIWLGFAADYRDLRQGAIGSLHGDYNFNRELKRLNDTGAKIVNRLLSEFRLKARHVAKYFLDMQQVAVKSNSMLSPGGVALFVIGNTKYKGVEIDNAKHLVESMLVAGFKRIQVAKRRPANKILNPNRDLRGKFSSDLNGRTVYSEEYIILGRKH